MTKSAEPIATYVTDPVQAMEQFDYADMMALAALYQSWALEEELLDGDQRTALIQWSADFERIADYAGPDWKASAPPYPETAEMFLARKIRAEEE